MPTVKITITADDGSVTEITQDMGAGDFSTFNEIEQFTLSVRREVFPLIQSELLRQEQSKHKKKGVIKAMDLEG